MADELNIKRIIELQQKTSPEEGDCFAVDNPNSGTNRITIQNLLDPTFSSNLKAAPAEETKKKIDEVMDVFAAGIDEAVDNWLDEHPEATTTVQDGSLTYKKLVTGTLGFVTPEMYGAVGDGVTDDTQAVQSAINSVYKCVLFESGKTYLVGSLTPAENKIIDLNGSNIKLKDSTNLPVFYSINNGATKKHGFTIMNGFIDCNMANNHAVNQSSGTFWFTGWEQLEFINLSITNAYRNIINLYNCENIYVRNVECEDCGLSGDSRFSYGATFEPTCKNVVIDNFTVKNMYGYGIHFNETENFHVRNCIFDTLSGTNRIGITCTKAKNGVIDNIICKDITGIGFEINASKEIAIDNVQIDACGGIPITFGDNGTGLNSSHIDLKNVVVTNTGGNYAITCNYLDDSRIQQSKFDKTITTVNNIVSSNIKIIDTEFNSDYSDTQTITRFEMNNVRFNNGVIDSSVDELHVKPNAKSIEIGVNESYEFDVSQVFRNGELLGGTLDVVAWFKTNKAQFSIMEFPVSIRNFTIGTGTLIVGVSYRETTVTMDSTNHKIIFTNNTDVILSFLPKLKVKRGRTA